MDSRATPTNSTAGLSGAICAARCLPAAAGARRDSGARRSPNSSRRRRGAMPPRRKSARPRPKRTRRARRPDDRGRGAEGPPFPRWRRGDEGGRTELDKALAEIPNLPLDEVPDGKDEHDNVEHHHIRGEARLRLRAQAAFRSRRSARADGFRDRGETLRRALRGVAIRAWRGSNARSGSSCSMCIRSEHGYTEVDPPLLVRDDAMFGTAQLPKFEDDQFLTAVSTAMIQETGRSADISRKRHDRARRLREYDVRDDIVDCCRTALAHPHRRSAAHQSRARIQSRRRQAAAALHRAARRASAPRRAPPARTRAA